MKRLIFMLFAFVGLLLSISVVGINCHQPNQLQTHTIEQPLNCIVGLQSVVSDITIPDVFMSGCTYTSDVASIVRNKYNVPISCIQLFNRNQCYTKNSSNNRQLTFIQQKNIRQPIQYNKLN